MPFPAHDQTDSAGAEGQSRSRRPIGFIRPGPGFVPQTGKHLQLAIKALDEGRWFDAETHIQAVKADEPATAWRCFLEGELHLRQGRLRQADPLFLRAASLSLAQLGSSCHAERSEASPVRDGPELKDVLRRAQNDEGAVEAAAGLETESAVGRDSRTNVMDVAQAMRLAAAALEAVGVVRRRFELFDQAARAHRLALELRREHGSLEEQWQSSLSLGLVARLAGDWDRAIEWCNQALSLAQEAGESPTEKHALAAEEMARSLSAAGRYSDALDAWKKALDSRRRHDPATADIPRVQLQMAEATVRQAETMIENGETAACANLLTEAVAALQESHDALAAFGPDTRHDTAQAARLLDFAGRLLISIE